MLLAALFAITTPQVADPEGTLAAGANETLQNHSLCRPAYNPNEASEIRIRVIRPHTSFRVAPSPDHIIKEGDRMHVIRNTIIWKHFASSLCGARSVAATARRDFIGRIFLYQFGKPESEGILVGYPDFEDPNPTIWFKYHNRFYELDRIAVRRLLDFASLG